MTPDAAELLLGEEQAGADPAFTLIAAMPAFDVPANGFDNGEGGFDHVGAGQRHPQLLRNMKPVNRQGFFQTFGQTARRARIQMHQFAVQSVERLSGRRHSLPSHTPRSVFWPPAVCFHR